MEKTYVAIMTSPSASCFEASVIVSTVVIVLLKNWRDKAGLTVKLHTYWLMSLIDKSLANENAVSCDK